jgi:signal transduction histidine kinase
VSAVFLDAGQRDRAFVETSVLRLLSVSFGASALILLGLNLPTAIQQWTLLPMWWSVGAIAVLVGPACVLLISGARARPAALQAVCAAHAAAFLILLLTPLALGHKLPDGAGMPWLVHLSMVAAAAASVAWGVRAIVAYNIALQAATFALVFLSSGDPVPGEALGDAIFGALYVTLLGALAFALRRASVRLDRTIESATVEAHTSARAEAMRTARRRVAALIHDRVIVALLAYSNRVGTDATAAAEAKSALQAIDDLDRVELRRDRTPVELAWELQAMTTELDADAAFEYTIASDGPLPAEVAEAIEGATAEALRNSIKHARPGSPVQRQVNVTVTQDLVEVVVLDDGSGFDLAGVAPTRLGVRQGIIARMGAVPNGHAQVTSTPGYGAIVALRWVRR